MTAYETIRVEREGAVAHLQLNRPERINALGKAMLQEIHAALDELEADPEVRAIVLSGADGDGAIGIKRIKERGGLTLALNQLFASRRTIEYHLHKGFIELGIKTREHLDRVLSAD